MLINTYISAMWSTIWSELTNITKNKNTLIDPSNILLALSLGGALAALSWARRRSAADPPLPPGPRGLPLVGYLPFLGTELHHKFTELARVYGPIFKFWLGNKLCVVISSPELVKEVLRDNDVVFANHDFPGARNIASYGRGHDVAFHTPEWKKLRKIFVRDMKNNAALEKLYGLRKEEVGEAVRFVKNKIGSPVDIGSLVSLTAMNSVLSMCGVGGSVAAGKTLGLNEATNELMRLLVKPNVSDVFPVLERLDLQGIERDVKSVLKMIYGVLDSAIEDRRNRMVTAGVSPGTDEGKEVRKDFLQFLLELINVDNGDGGATVISDDEIKALVLVRMN